MVLRLARPEDADALAQGFADDPILGAMLGIEPDHQNAEWLRSTFREDGQNGEGRKAYWFAIAHAESGEPIGEIGLVGISWPNRRAGLSILVLPGSRRVGVAREAIELLVGWWAQGELGLHRIELHTLPENAPMQGLAEASGFMREGILRDYTFERGRFVDNVVYARPPGPTAGLIERSTTGSRSPTVGLWGLQLGRAQSPGRSGSRHEPPDRCRRSRPPGG